MEENNGKVVKLSRFFKDNVKIVADMCPKCYQETCNVKFENCISKIKNYHERSDTTKTDEYSYKKNLNHSSKVDVFAISQEKGKRNRKDCYVKGKIKRTDTVAISTENPLKKPTQNFTHTKQTNQDFEENKSKKERDKFKGFTIEELDKSVQILKIIYRKINELSDQVNRRKTKKSVKIRPINLKKLSLDHSSSKDSKRKRNPSKISTRKGYSNDETCTSAIASQKKCNSSKNNNNNTNESETNEGSKTNSEYSFILNGFATAEIQKSMEICENFQSNVEKFCAISDKTLNRKAKKISFKNLKRASYEKKRCKIIAKVAYPNTSTENISKTEHIGELINKKCYSNDVDVRSEVISEHSSKMWDNSCQKYSPASLHNVKKENLECRHEETSSQCLYSKNESLEFQKEAKSTYSTKEGNDHGNRATKKDPDVKPINFSNLFKMSELKSIQDEYKTPKIEVDIDLASKDNILNSPEIEPTKLYIPKWHPPRSPHNLIEEILYHDPWALLVATIFLNKTSCMCARPYILEFLKDYPTPYEVLKTEPSTLEKYFTNIGLKKRSVQIWRMSQDFLHKNWTHVRELYGIGKYGEDAYRMFCLGDLNVEPKDRFLKIYKAWYEMTEKQTKQEDFANSDGADVDPEALL